MKLKKMFSVDIIHNGELRQLQVPSSPQEVKYDNYLEFSELFRKYVDGDGLIAIENITACLVAVFGEKVADLPFEAENEGFEVGQQVTVRFLFDHFTNLCAYEQDAQTFYDKDFHCIEVKGEKFYLQGRKARLLNGFTEGKQITTREVIEMQHIAAAFEQMKATQRECDLTFTASTYLMAMLYRKEGEQLPLSPGELDTFIEQRKELFREASLQDATGAIFFLTLKQVQYLEQQVSNPTQKVLNRAQTRLAEKRMRGKSTTTTSNKKKQTLKPLMVVRD